MKYTTVIYLVCAVIWLANLVTSPSLADLACVAFCLALAWYDHMLTKAVGFLNEIVGEAS